LRVLVDVLTPKQARFFSKLGERLRESEVDVIYTTRSYYESERMLHLLGTKATKLGRFGESLYDKVLFSAQRLEAYVKFLSRRKPDLVVSFGSPEAARASFGLAIPHIMANDSPHAEAVARLTVPLSRKLFTPWVIPRAVWAPFGIPEDNVIQYRGLDQTAWMKGVRVEPLGSIPDELLMIYRPEEYRAAYVSARDNASAEFFKRTLDILKSKTSKKVRALVLCRYGYSPAYRKLLGPTTVVPKRPLDAVDLLKRAASFFGHGGTMTGEAALLGIPTVSLSRRANLVEEFLVKEGLVSKPQSPEAAADLLLSFYAQDGEKMKSQRERASALLDRMEDPTERISSFIVGGDN